MDGMHYAVPDDASDHGSIGSEAPKLWSSKAFSRAQVMYGDHIPLTLYCQDLEAQV